MARVADPYSPERPRSDANAIEARTQQLGRELLWRAERYQPSPLEAVGDR